MTWILLAAAFFMLTRKNKKLDLSNLSDMAGSASSILNLFKGDKPMDMSSLLELLSNPAVMSVLSGIFGNNGDGAEQGQSDKGDCDQEQSDCGQSNTPHYSKGQGDCAQSTRPPSDNTDIWTFGAPQADCPDCSKNQKQHGSTSQERQNSQYQEQWDEPSFDEFFAPVASVVTPTVNGKLYELYENWYVTNPKGR